MARLSVAQAGAGAALLALTILLQGCEEEFSCGELAVTRGKLPATVVGFEAVVQCDEGLEYHGQFKVQCQKGNKVCRGSGREATERANCRSSAGFAAVNSEQTVHEMDEGTDFDGLKAESEAIRDRNHADLSKVVQCGMYASTASKAWANLTPAEVKAAGVLGYTQMGWDNARVMPVDDKTWAALTDAEKAAATTLGYNEAIWNWKPEAVSSEEKFSLTSLEPTRRFAATLVGFCLVTSLVVLFSVRFLARRARQVQNPTTDGSQLIEEDTMQGGEMSSLE